MRARDQGESGEVVGVFAFCVLWVQGFVISELKLAFCESALMATPQRYSFVYGSLRFSYHVFCMWQYAFQEVEEETANSYFT